MNKSTPDRPAQARLLPWLITVLAVAFAAGCNRQPYSCIKVSGKVTYEDGSLIPGERIILHFIPQTPAVDPKRRPKNAYADVDVTTGEFNSATTYTPGDGIIAGEHKVIVQCIRKGELARDLVADRYADSAQTPLTVRSSDSPFALTVHKPGS